MICYTHRDKQALAICKNCSKAICEQCAIPDDNGFACTEKCHQEIMEYVHMMEKSKMMYGLRPGRIPTQTILMVVVGLFIASLGMLNLLSGVLSLLSGDSFDFVGLAMGVIGVALGVTFLALGVVSYMNTKKTGLRV